MSSPLAGPHGEPHPSLVLTVTSPLAGPCGERWPHPSLVPAGGLTPRWSPQVALVQWTESVGLTLVSRDLTSMQLRTPGGQILTYCILQTFPFTSESKRMGVIVRVCLPLPRPGLALLTTGPLRLPTGLYACPRIQTDNLCPNGHDLEQLS